MNSDLDTTPNCAWKSPNDIACPHAPAFVVQSNPLRDEGEFEFACSEHLGVIVTEVIGRPANEGLTAEVIPVEDFFAPEGGAEQHKHVADA